MAFTFKSFFHNLENIAQGSAESQKRPPDNESPDMETVGEDTSSSLGRVLLGSVDVLAGVYFPNDLIGGCCPRLAGKEEEIVWHAAAEATDSERIHVAWQAQDDKIWYLAIRSSEMASHPGTWCPFASFLPGLKDAAEIPACYTYYSHESAAMMTILQDGLQIHRGTAGVIRAKAERTARELGNAPLIELVPDIMEELTPKRWYSLSMFEERARRILATISVAAAVILLGIIALVWFLAAMSAVSTRYDVKEIHERTAKESLEFMNQVRNLRSSPLREQLGRFADLNDGLLAINGWLDIYQIKDDKVLWRAIVPPSVTADRITGLGGKTLENAAQGVVIGNAQAALKLGVQ